MSECVDDVVVVLVHQIPLSRPTRPVHITHTARKESRDTHRLEVRKTPPHLPYSWSAAVTKLVGI